MHGLKCGAIPRNQQSRFFSSIFNDLISQLVAISRKFRREFLPYYLKSGNFYEEDLPYVLRAFWNPKPNKVAIERLNAYFLIKREKDKDETKDEYLLKIQIEKENLNQEIKQIRIKRLNWITKITQMIKVSKRISWDIMMTTLRMNKKEFIDNIWNWAEKFGFLIDGDFIIMENADVKGFIESLDGQFQKWGENSNQMKGK